MHIAPVNVSFQISPSADSDEDGNHSILLSKTSNGVSSSLEPLNKYFFSSDTYLELMSLKLSSYNEDNFSFIDSSDTKSRLLSLSSCLNEVTALSRNSMTLQRYKGLGEMNPDQLEETTMNLKSRTLLQVLPLEDGNSVVVELMGDDVELRKEFIKQKYSSVKNLDI